MKKKKALSMIALCATLLFFSCSSKNALIEVPVNPKDIAIQGQFSPYYEVVNSTYKLIKPKDQDAFTLKLEIKRTNEPFKFDYNVVDMGKRGFIQIYCDLYDDSGVPVIIADEWGGGLKLNESGSTNMLDLGLGKTGWIEIDFGYNFNKEDIEKANSFSIRSDFDESSIESFNSPSNSLSFGDISDEEILFLSGNTNWDEVLADYEAYTDKYIKLLKKANSGDASAFIEYVEMLEKAQELQESLADAENVMTLEQLEKFTLIQQKLLSGASGY